MNNTNPKFIESFDVSDWEVETDTGWEDIQYTRKTIPYVIWEIKTDNGLSLKCADIHILFDSNMNEVYVKDLKIGDSITTKYGNSKIVSIIETADSDNMYDLSISGNHRYYTNDILSHNSTAYCAYLTYRLCFSEDLKICILADNGETAKEFIDRILFAFEALPQWIKPGVESWNKHSIKLANGCKVESKNTTVKSARGLSFDILVFDEFAWVDNDFQIWQSAYPSISSNPNTQAIIVSTPNGTGNKFYDIWQLANTPKDSENYDQWVPIIGFWHQVPGRDEAWKRTTQESLNDKRAWDIEYDLKFIGGSDRLLEDGKVEEITTRIITQQIKPIIEYKIGEYVVDIFYKPRFDITYVIGVDVGDGVGGDPSVIKVFDVTDIKNIKEVATFRNDKISPTRLAYVAAKIGYFYNTAPITVEYNGVGATVVKYLIEIYAYDNLYWYSDSQAGILSNNKLKRLGCLWFKLLVESCNVEINDRHLADELTHFVKKQKKNAFTYEAEKKFHDDCVMASIWALFILQLEYIESYFEDVTYTELNGELIPWKITVLQQDYEDRDSKLQDLDKIFNKINRSDLGNNKTEEIKEDFSLADIVNEMNSSNGDGSSMAFI